jgi:Ni,Fe-hydrogenase maturation factor
MSPEKRFRILVFGNPLLRRDSLPLRLIPGLRERFPKIEFVEFDPNESLEKEGRQLNIIDTVEGIDQVTLITDIDSLKMPKAVSMHDLDLGATLKILKKMALIEKARIFGVPMDISEEEALRQLTELIASTIMP